MSKIDTTSSRSELLALNELDQLLKKVTQTSVGRRAFLAAMPFLLSACATQEKHRDREGDNSGQQTEMTVEDEKRLTKEALQEMRKDYPPSKNPQLQSYISNLGMKVARANALEGNPYNYTFTVIDVNMVNAFALPAGTVYVTAPLIAMADSEDELAGVVGHEIGHIKARHTAERMEKAKREQPKQWIYGAGGGLLGGVLGYGIGKLACPPKDNECLAKAAGIGAAAGVGGGLLIHKYGFMANSREDEMEADRIGFRTAVNAGYHKDHVGRFYEKLLKMEQQSKQSNVPLLSSVTDAMSTHPPSKERVAQMNEMASQQSQTKSATISTASFDQIKKIVASK